MPNKILVSPTNRRRYPKARILSLDSDSPIDLKMIVFLSTSREKIASLLNEMHDELNDKRFIILRCQIWDLVDEYLAKYPTK